MLTRRWNSGVEESDTEFPEFPEFPRLKACAT
jgi:hypothetical protein